MPAPIVNAPNGPYAAGTTPTYTGLIVDSANAGIPAAILVTLTLTLVDTLTGNVVLAATNILNTGRGTVDADGNLTVQLQTSDTAFDTGSDQLQRSMILDWTYDTSPVLTGRHQVNFILLALSGA